MAIQQILSERQNLTKGWLIVAVFAVVVVVVVA
jgi:hypothetical protein